jgi:hypothetical protein
MSASLKPLTTDEFLAWERFQPLRYEFDGTQPVAKTGGTIAADRVARRLLLGLGRRLRSLARHSGRTSKSCPVGGCDIRT